MSTPGGTTVRVHGRATPLTQAEVRRVASGVLGAERREAELSITFLGPEPMRELNRKYKQHDRPTDVLSFPLSAPDGALAGDVYICRDAAAEAAREYGIPLREELLRLVVHGTLHVLGHDHPEGAGRTRSAMWRRQERYVRRFA